MARAPDSAPPAEAVPLGVAEPPFSLADWTWMNGSNYQPAFLLYEFRGPTAGQVIDGKPTPPNGVMTGASLTWRIEWTRRLMITLHGDLSTITVPRSCTRCPLAARTRCPATAAA